MSNFSENIEYRLTEIKDSEIIEYIKHALEEFQHSLDITPTVVPVSVYIVGSVLTEEFESGQSDIDIIVGVDNTPSEDVTENFWRDWEDTYSTDSNIQNQIQFDYYKLDICGVYKNELLQNQNINDPHYQLRDPYYQINC